MGFFSKVFKKVTNAVKGVAKGIVKVAKKVVKGIGKAINKLGPIAAIAVGYFMPTMLASMGGSFGSWMAKEGILQSAVSGAATGFITSGGNLKGAVVGAAGGALGGAARQFKNGFDSLGSNASFTDKLGAGFENVGTAMGEAGDAIANGARGLFETAPKEVQSNFAQSYGEATQTYADENLLGDVTGGDISGVGKTELGTDVFNPEVEKLFPDYQDAVKTYAEENLVDPSEVTHADMLEKATGLSGGMKNPYLQQSLEAQEAINTASVTQGTAKPDWMKRVGDALKKLPTGVQRATMTPDMDVSPLKDTTEDLQSAGGGIGAAGLSTEEMTRLGIIDPYRFSLLAKQRMGVA